MQRISSYILLLEVVKPTTYPTYMCALLTKQYAYKPVCGYVAKSLLYAMLLIYSQIIDICYAMQCTQATATAMQSGDGKGKEVQTST